MTREQDVAELRAKWTAAWTAGRYAESGATNPYYGQGTYARAWRLGYHTMMVDALNRSPARQAFLDAQKETP